MFSDVNKNLKDTILKNIQNKATPFSSPFLVHNVKGDLQAGLMVEKLTYEYGIFLLRDGLWEKI